MAGQSICHFMGVGAIMAKPVRGTDPFLWAGEATPAPIESFSELKCLPEWAWLFGGAVGLGACLAEAQHLWLRELLGVEWMAATIF